MADTPGFFLSYTLDPRCVSALFDDIKADPDAAIRSRGRILKHDGTTTVALIEDGGRRWVIKRYNTKNLWHLLRRTVRRSRASNCWGMSRLFRQAEITTPAPVAFIEKRCGPLRGKSYFVSEYVEADNLAEHLLAGENGDTAKVKRQAVALFEKLRAAGINHGDMKASNILVADHELSVIDFDAAARPGSNDAFERGYHKDRARFLKNWLGHDELYAYFDGELPGRQPGP